MNLLRRIARFALTGTLGLVAIGCEGEGGEITALCGPRGDDMADFAPVSLVLERRCGTLDCHGTYARPMRIFGAGGLRKVGLEDLPTLGQGGEDAVSGGVGTTVEEFEANHTSVCGLEPELTTRVVLGEEPPNALKLLRKPLLLEQHKGAQLFLEGGPGATCVSCWLRGFPDTVDCEDALTGCADAIQDQL